MGSEHNGRDHVERDDHVDGQASTDPHGEPGADEVNQAEADGFDNDVHGRPSADTDAPAEGVLDDDAADPPEPSEPG